MPPVDRNQPGYKALNESTERLIDTAYRLRDINKLGFEGAHRALDQIDPQIAFALKYNLRPDATWSVNIEALFRNKKELFGYPDNGSFFGPTLFLNGEDSFQDPVQNEIRYYRKHFPHAQYNDLLRVRHAGHAVHFDQPRVCTQLLHSFLLSNLKGTEK